MDTTSPADARALLVAAIAADAEGNADRFLELLRRSVAAEHLNPNAHYLLGAEYAERGAHGDAVLHLTTAVEQAPQLHEARLQLGLLWLTLDNYATASAVLQPLRALPEEQVLHHFGNALCELAEGRVVECCAAVRRGLEIGSPNVPLLADMGRLLQRLELGNASADAEEALRSVQHGMAISAYSGGDPADR
jgi:tetratricopeptide (TPR) repeat protein